MSKLTKQKYGELIMDISTIEQFRIDEMRMKYKVSTRVFTIMRDLGYIKSIPYGMNIWHADAPTQITINRIIKECRTSSKIEKVLAKNTTTQQLTIKPLKRIAPVRQPVQAEEQHTPYPIMDIVIAFLAGMIAAGFVSLIWK